MGQPGLLAGPPGETVRAAAHAIHSGFRPHAAGSRYTKSTADVSAIDRAYRTAPSQCQGGSVLWTIVTSARLQMQEQRSVGKCHSCGRRGPSGWPSLAAKASQEGSRAP